jgi:hypothetical protein
MAEQSPTKKLFAEVSIGNTERELVERYARATGLGKVTRRKAQDANQSDVFIWRCYADGAVSFLKQIRRYLPMKAPIVDHVLRATQQMATDRTLAYEPKWRRAVVQRSKELNERGPVGAKRRMKAAKLSHLQHLRRLSRKEPYAPQNSLGVLDTLKERDRLTAVNLPLGTALCPACDVQYRLPKRPTRDRPGTSCGKRECAYAQRRRRGKPCNVLHPYIARSLAELLEAEGCIGIARSGRTIHGRVDFGNTEEGIVDVLAKLVGPASITERPPKEVAHATSWHLRLQSDGAHGLAEQVHPFLKKKRRQAELLMYVHERLQHPRSRVVKAEWQEQAIAISKCLNEKGPVQVPDNIDLDGLWMLTDKSKGATSN